MNSKAWVLAAAALSAGMAQATCYSVYRGDGALIREGSRTPVDLSLPLGDTVPEKFGEGASLTMSGSDHFCKERQGPGAARKLAMKSTAGKRVKTADKPQAAVAEPQAETTAAQAQAPAPEAAAPAAEADTTATAPQAAAPAAEPDATTAR
jgi:hypothetical protein